MPKTFVSMLVAVTLVASLSFADIKAQKEEKTEREPFGYSLSFLKWDPVSGHAIDYSQMLKTKVAKSDLSKKRSDLQYTSKAPSNASPDITLQSTLVVFDVLVTDKQGQYVNGLTRNDFAVYEENTQQQIGTCAIGGGVPRSIILIIDYSSSEFPFFTASIDAAKNLISRLGPDDRMAIVTDDVDLITDYTTDKAKLSNALESLRSRAKHGHHGKSLQFSALMAAMRELIDDDSRTIVIFQTDGDEAFLLRDQEHAREHFYPELNIPPSGEFGLVDVINKAKRTQATIYSVVPGEQLINVSDAVRTERGGKMYKQAQDAYYHTRDLRVAPEETLDKFIGLHMLGQFAASFVADATSGWTGYLSSPNSATEIYGKILADINHRYVIGYYPTNAMYDGKSRKVRIEVRGHPDYVVSGRTAYYPPKSKDN